LDVDPQAALFRSYDSFCFPLRQCGLLQAAMVVGDTLADIGMGRMANVGCTVGVLSGVCGTDQLIPHAHHIVSFPFDLQHWDLRAAFQGMVSDVGKLMPIVFDMRQNRRIEAVAR
uniref:HAD family hydrolase n=1 Tax=Toxocara canis TaxID=6265 RepID=A0A183U2J0_TOXCA